MDGGPRLNLDLNSKHRLSEGTRGRRREALQDGPYSSDEAIVQPNWTNIVTGRRDTYEKHMLYWAEKAIRGHSRTCLI